MTSPNTYNLNQKIHIAMMEVMDRNYTTLDQTLEQIASNEFTEPAVFTNNANESKLCQFRL